MKTFDFELAEKTRNPNFVKWLKENHNKTVTEEEFVNFKRSLKSETKGRLANYSPSSIKVEYRNLKKNFGFFPSK